MPDFTPGTWVCHLGDPLAECDCNSVLGEGQRGYGAIATVHYDGEGIHGMYEGEYEDRATAKANACLIAAAPDLYAALSALVQINEEHNEAVAAVIGRPVGWKDSELDAARAALKKATEGI